MNVPVPTPCPMRDTTTAMYQVEALESVVVQLRLAVEDLEKRAADALEPYPCSPPASDSVDPNPGTTPLARKIWQHGYEVAGLVRRIETLTNHLKV